jgi:hypothetical protein
MGGDPKSSLGGPRTAREVAGRPVPGPILFVKSSATRASLPALHARGANASRATSISVSSLDSPRSSPYSHVVLRLQKHEARRFVSPGFAGNSKSTLDLLFRGSPGEGAIHYQALGSLRMAGPEGCPARLGRLVDGCIHHVSRKNLVCLLMIECCHAASRASTPFER